VPTPGDIARPRLTSTTRRRHYGPTIRTCDALDDAGKVALERDILDLVAQFNRANDGSMVVPSEYLEAVIVVR
jgi:hypothetical protein